MTGGDDFFKEVIARILAVANPDRIILVNTLGFGYGESKYALLGLRALSWEAMTSASSLFSVLNFSNFITYLSIRAGGTKVNWKDRERRFTIGASSALLLGDNFFESFAPRALSFLADFLLRITVAIASGPTTQPLPASSVPDIFTLSILLISSDVPYRRDRDRFFE